MAGDIFIPLHILRKPTNSVFISELKKEGN